MGLVYPVRPSLTQMSSKNKPNKSKRNMLTPHRRKLLEMGDLEFELFFDELVQSVNAVFSAMPAVHSSRRRKFGGYSAGLD